MLHDAAFEALTLIHEIGSPGKFSGDLALSENRAIENSVVSPENDLPTNVLNEEIYKQVTSGVSNLKLDASKHFQPKVAIAFHMIDLSCGLSAESKHVYFNFFRISQTKV